MLDDFGFEEAIRGYCNESTVNTDPAKRIEIICEEGFNNAFLIAARCPNCRENGLNELDRHATTAKKLLRQLDAEQKLAYEEMINNGYQKCIERMAELTFQEREYVPQQQKPQDRIEQIISHGFPRAVRIADVSKERGIRIFNDYAEEAYNMLRKLDIEEKEKYQALLDEKYDESFAVVMSGVQFTE